MGYVSVRSAPPNAVFEVDGTLDLARVHDLRRAVRSAARSGCVHVDVDLSRVEAAARSVGLVALMGPQDAQPRSA